MNKKILFLILTLIIVAAGSGAVFSLYKYNNREKSVIMMVSLIELSPEEIIKQSDGVIIGTVKGLKTVKAQSSFSGEGENDIVTNATISVEKYLFNPQNLDSSEIVVQTFGGTIGNETMFTEDEPKFEKDQHVIIFLRQAQNGFYIVFGYSQGAYTINGNEVAIGEKEQNTFNNVFGGKMTLDELENKISDIISSSTAEN